MNSLVDNCCSSMIIAIVTFRYIDCGHCLNIPIRVSRSLCVIHAYFVAPHTDRGTHCGIGAISFGSKLKIELCLHKLSAFECENVPQNVQQRN